LIGFEGFLIQIVFVSVLHNIDSIVWVFMILTMFFTHVLFHYFSIFIGLHWLIDRWVWPDRDGILSVHLSENLFYDRGSLRHISAKESIGGYKGNIAKSRKSYMKSY